MLTFGVSGKLIMNGLVMYDRETGSLWSQIIGRGVEGQFKGVELTHLAALQTTWEAWASAHPDTLVLDKRGGYRVDSYTSYYARSSAGIIGETNKDDRLDTKDLMVGVMLNGTAKAYPFDELEKTPVVNDVIEGVPVLVVFDSESTTGVVFDPALEGDLLEFRRTGTGGKFTIQDTKTGSVWDPLTGKSIDGPLAGAALEQVPAHYEFWFSWTDYRPDTELYLP